MTYAHGLFLLWAAMMVATCVTQGAGEAQRHAPFRVVQRDRVWWLITPDGKPFFSLGVCCVTPGESWLQYKPKNPSYAAWKYYPDAISWADTTLERLKSWGFSTLGGWSDVETLRRSSKMEMPFTLVLHLGATAGAPWWDMWDKRVIARMDEAARNQILSVRDDPRLLGYFTDNEIGWWNAALFQMTLQQSPQSEQRRRLVRLLRQYYHGDWRKLRNDFAAEGAGSFEALARRGRLYLRPGGGGIKPIKRFVNMLAERYYFLVRQIVRKYDRRGLLLGDRYQSFYYPEVAWAAQRYVDVVSTNLNPNWNDGSFVRFYLDTLHALTGKPVMIGEFYMTATENRSGNKNDSSGFPVVTTQRERAAGFVRTLRTLVQTPFVVGADWFQYYDEPTFGRDDGENYNMGLVDIHDRPYEEITQAAAFDRNALHSAPPPRLDATGGVPPAPKEPMACGNVRQALRDWDRERGFVPPKSRFPTADLYLCWDEHALYAGLYAYDIVEEAYYKDHRVPEIERAEWSFRLAGAPQAIRVRCGAGRPPVAHGDRADTLTLYGEDNRIHSIAIVRLPAALFGKERLQAGDILGFSSTFLSHARAYQVEWTGRFRLSGPLK